MKKQITLRVDGKVMDWYKSQGKGYHSLMNQVLCTHYQGKIEVERAVSKIRKVLDNKKPIIPKNKQQLDALDKICTIQSDQDWRTQIKANPKQGKKAKK